APSLTPEQRNGYLGAINEAADRIMADFGKYKHYVTGQTKGRLAPHEMSDHFVRYTHYVVYDPKRFSQVYEWMRSWGLATGGADHARVVARLYGLVGVQSRFADYISPFRGFLPAVGGEFLRRAGHRVGADGAQLVL